MGGIAGGGGSTFGADHSEFRSNDERGSGSGLDVLAANGDMPVGDLGEDPEGMLVVAPMAGEFSIVGDGAGAEPS